MLDNPYLRETLRAVLPPELSFISGIIIVIIIIIIVITIVIIIIIVIIVIMVTTNYNYINILIYILMIIKQFIHLTLGKRKHHCPRDPPEVRSFNFILDFCVIFLISIWIWIWIFVTFSIWI